MKLALIATSVLALAACTDGAPAEPNFDEGVLIGTGQGDDASFVADAGPLPDPCADAGDRGDGSTFTDLYRDFFGPTGLASCSARSICHVPGGTGQKVSGGYICFPDRTICWESMTSTIVPDGGSATPEKTTLYKVLRKAPPTPGSGPMPRNSAFAFCPNDLARIKEWISSGAKND